jgi:serine/threonine protein kinase
VLKKRTLTFPEMMEAMLDCAKGMAYLTSKHVIHRDLACRNLLVNEDGRVVVRYIDLLRISL